MRKIVIEEFSEPILEVTFSKKLYEILMEIENYNQNNSGVVEWKQYLNGLIHLLSYQKNALDYASKSRCVKNKKTGENLVFVHLQDNNMGYKLAQYDENEPISVCVFKIELKLQDYGLKLPPWITLPVYIKENKQLQNNSSKVNIIIGTQLVRHIVKSVIREFFERQVLNESYTTRRIGKYTVVYGDNQPHSIEGLENYGDNLYDIAMYNSKEEHICVFSIGRNTKKFICCNLEYDKDYGEWLGFTPIKSYDVPTLIRQDLRERFTNS